MAVNDLLASKLISIRFTAGPLNPNDRFAEWHGTGHNCRGPVRIIRSVPRAGQPGGQQEEDRDRSGLRHGRCRVVVEHEGEHQAFSGRGGGIAGQGVDVGEVPVLARTRPWAGVSFMRSLQGAIDAGDGQAGAKQVCIPVLVHVFEQGDDGVGGDQSAARQARAFVEVHGPRGNPRFGEEIAVNSARAACSVVWAGFRGRGLERLTLAADLEEEGLGVEVLGRFHHLSDQLGEWRGIDRGDFDHAGVVRSRLGGVSQSTVRGGRPTRIWCCSS
jgi:hypothetical protein